MSNSPLIPILGPQDFEVALAAQFAPREGDQSAQPPPDPALDCTSNGI